ncbi:uncharacterized protein FIESC28_09678 [Fusarium coffeatum]|uniref:Uncharacterized protein n=1 Tax=Fusarium coffeatum TaxID=231269 RepID=A0A366QYX2_9HYPO|nr:uncharacterized protein FIESC28_09678 [Fusarium coffeatum]RBR09932.1 hypothetical protein FIESC28_09678 [Fusarium coffeatum]
MQTVTIPLGVFITLIILIVLLIVILVFVFTRPYCVEPSEREPDEAALRPLTEAVNQPRTSDIRILNSASDRILSKAPSPQCKAPPRAPTKYLGVPVVALAADDIMEARKWMAKRGIREGSNVDSWAGEYELTLDPQPNDRVQGGILLPSLSKQARKKWKESGKPAMVEGKDPVVEIEEWAPSLTYPFTALLARVTSKTKVYETKLV